MKKYFCSIVFSVLMIGLFSSCLLRNSYESKNDKHYITVSGSGKVSVEPDLISMNFVVRTVDWSVNRAVEKNAANTANVLSALKNAGVADDDVSTDDYRISQDNLNNYPGQYTVSNTINVIIRNISIAGTVIDAAVRQNTGANGITSFQYLVSDSSSAMRHARTLAIQDAQDAASLLAGASGCKVGAVADIREDYTTTSSGNDMMLMAKAVGEASSPTSIKQGKITITSNVTIKYILEN